MDVPHLIQSAVAPVFLLSGVGVTLGVLTNRLARIVDRARALEADLEKGGSEAGELTRRLRHLAKRARYINAAVTLATVAALLVALTVVLLFADAFVALDLQGAVAVVFVAAMLALTAALMSFLIEVRIATATLRIGGRRVE
jgi:hypothetical protein